MDLNNEPGLLIVCALEGMANMLAFRLTSASAFLFCLLCACPYATNAQHAETYIVPVTVVSLDGKPLTSLQSENVRIHESGVTLKSFNLDSSSRRIVLLFDTSGSMMISNGSVTLLQAAVHTASLFLDRVSSADFISLHAFAGKDKELVPFTHDVGAIRAAMNNLPKPEGRTDLDNALNSILRVLSESPQFGDVIVIFSDGLLPRSNEDNVMVYYDPPDYLERMKPRLGMAGVRVFFSLAGNIQGAQSLHGIELFMGATGGESFELKNAGPTFYGGIYDHPEAAVYRSNSLEQRAVMLSTAIQDTYRLELKFAKPLEKPARLHFGFVDERGKALHNLTVLSPEFAYPDAGHQFPPR